MKDPSLLSPFRVALLQNQVCDLIASDYHRLCSAPFASSSGLPCSAVCPPLPPPPPALPPPSLDEHLRTLRITPLLVKGLIAGGRADSPMHILMPQTISFFFLWYFLYTVLWCRKVLNQSSSTIYYVCKKNYTNWQYRIATNGEIHSLLLMRHQKRAHLVFAHMCLLFRNFFGRAAESAVSCT